VQDLIALAHSADLNTNLILLQARDAAEWAEKRTSMWADFLSVRQMVLWENQRQDPAHPFFGPKAAENGALHSIYKAAPAPGSAHDAFFADTRSGYGRFVAGMEKLEGLLVLPYAAGEEVTLADLHLVPWLAHALWGVGTTEITDFSVLERHLGKSVEGFRVGEKTRKWWGKVGERESFKKVFPAPH
jgi:glutathione S-transferase